MATTIVRDYGTLNGISSGNSQFNFKRRTQVYQATHEGERYLPFMQRSFISFSYGGKNIEEFNLIATVSSDRWEKDGYAEFEDLTTDYDVINGQFYWNTYFHTNTFNFQLSTDSMTQTELDEFLRWFKAGEIKELILAEHPNRAILARVSEVPHISMIPFEVKKPIQLNNTEYTVSTTEYKGDIELSLVSDDPFWYAKVNVFGHFDSSLEYSNWQNANGEDVGNLTGDPDIIKIIHEDGIPLSTMVKETIALGGAVYATVETELRSKIADSDGVTEEDYINSQQSAGNSWYCYDDDPDTHERIYYKGAAISADNVLAEFAPGIIAGAFMSNTSSINYLNPESAADDNYVYFYYPGTAPSPMTLEFDIFPKIDSASKLIITPKNKFTDSATPYNSIFIESITKQELKLTTPNMYTSYNQIINMLDTQIGESWVQIRKLIRDTIHHAIVRAWANRVIDKITNGETICTQALSATAKDEMAKLFISPENDNLTLRTSIKIDSRTGEAVGTFTCRDPEDENKVATITESIQDMLLSNNLIIKDRNFFDEQGNVVHWAYYNNTTKTYSHRMYHNLEIPLFNLRITYQNLYL